MRRRIKVSDELKRLRESGATCSVVFERLVRRGDAAVRRQAPVKIVYIEGIGVEYRFLINLLTAFKQTRVRSVTVEAVPGGLHILFDRAFYFLKGIEDG